MGRGAQQRRLAGVLSGDRGAGRVWVAAGEQLLGVRRGGEKE